MGLIEAFAEASWQITFASCAEPTPYSVDLSALGIPSRQITVNDSAFDAWVQELKPDWVVFDRYMTEEQFGWRVEKASPQAQRLLDTSDLHCLRAARERQVNHGGELALFNDIALREVAAIYRSDLTLMISEVEIQLLQELFQIPPTLLSYLPLMVAEPIRPPKPYEEREHFAMIGNYLHPPNWDAVRWCSSEIWPRIRQALPQAELHCYGAYEPDKARQLANAKQGIVFKGRAANALETLSRYRVNLAPLRYGAGQKGKILDGFCSSTPTVTTPVGAESMHGSIDWGCAITNDPQAFAETASAVYTHREHWERVQQQGHQIIQERFLASHWKPELLKVLENHSTDSRKQNFIGQMLRHHQHRSTEYMSRWIEAKQKLALP